MIYLITGKAGAGKTHYSRALAKELKEDGNKVRLIDGDNFRDEYGNKDFTDAGRTKNLYKAAELARQHEGHGCIVILAFIAPRRAWRDYMRALWEESRVIYIPGGTLWKGTEYERPLDEELDLRRQ